MPEGITNSGPMPPIQIPAYLRNNGYNKASNPEMQSDGGIPHDFTRQRAPMPIRRVRPTKS